MASTLVNTTGGVTINDGPVLSGRLEIEQQIIDVTMANATNPDLTWELIDANGHFHAYATDGELPTLVTRSRHVQCDGEHAFGYEPELGEECEGYDVTEYFCRVCDQMIEPHRVPDSGPKSTPGLKSWVVTAISDRPVEERSVSVRFAIQGKVYFGTAALLVHSMEGDSGGRLRVTMKLHGTGPLGVR